MKVLVFAASLFLATSVFAKANQAELSCTSSFGSNGSTVLGYRLEITKTDVDYTGVMSLICTNCRIVPTMIHFQKQLVGTNAIYTSAESRLTVALESLMPTRTHAAIFATRQLNKGKAISFTCQN